jgi:predicted negative regulator of RcsB-dependent stress response
MQSNVAQLPLSDKLWAWFEANRKPAAFVAVLLALAGLIIWFLIWRHDQTELAASYALTDVTVSPAAAEQPRQDQADAYLKIAAEYPRSGAGTRALLLAAGSFFNQGKYSEAQAQFERFTREHRDSPYLGQAALGIATCLDAQGKTDQALTAYKDLIARHPNESFIPQAKFALARLYIAQNKPELARDLYEDVERTDQFFGPEAGMQLEDLKTKYPQIFPPPAAPKAASAPTMLPLAPAGSNTTFKSTVTNSALAPLGTNPLPATGTK